MPEPLTTSEVNSQIDPSVSKQYDNSTPISKQITDFFSFADSSKTCLLTTVRPSLGPVARSMVVSKRIGPDFLFLANNHSRKFQDLKADSTVQLGFLDSSRQNWASVTGKATTISNSDPRIKDLYNPIVAAWFGDLGDGKHTGTAEDPRMTLIEVKADYIVYWLSTSTRIGALVETAQASLTGKVATTGVTRELKRNALEEARKTQ